MSSSVTSKKLLQKPLNGRETETSLLPSRNSKINATDMKELQCGCIIAEIDGILLVECKPHKEGMFRD